jgi:hypothetical protein
MPTTRRFKIRPGTASRWVILSDDGEPVLSGQEYREPREAVAELKARALSEGFTMIATQHRDGSFDVTFEAPGTTQLVINLPPSLRVVVDRVIDQTRDTPGQMFAKALGLYQLALEAKSRGKHVGSAESPDVLEVEFTGF